MSILSSCLAFSGTMCYFSYKNSSQLLIVPVVGLHSGERLTPFAITALYSVYDGVMTSLVTHR